MLFSPVFLLALVSTVFAAPAIELVDRNNEVATSTQIIGPVSGPSGSESDIQQSGSNRNGNSNGGSFNGDRSNDVTVVTVEERVCIIERVDIVEKKVAILREMIKRTILEEQCSIETAVVIIENASRNIRSWTESLRSGSANFNSQASNLGQMVFATNDTTAQEAMINSAANGTFASGDVNTNNATVPAQLIGNNGTNIVNANATRK